MSKNIIAAARNRPAPGCASATPSATGSCRRTPTSGQEGAQPIEVSAGSGPSGSSRLRHRGRWVSRCQSCRRRHQDQSRVGSFSCQFINQEPGPRPSQAVTGHRPPRGRGAVTLSGAARTDGVTGGGACRAHRLPDAASLRQPSSGFAFRPKRGRREGPCQTQLRNLTPVFTVDL